MDLHVKMQDAVDACHASSRGDSVMKLTYINIIVKRTDKQQPSVNIVPDSTKLRGVPLSPP